VSSIEPNHRSDAIDGAEEVSSGLVIAGGDAKKLFELGKEIFNQVPGFVEVYVVLTRLFTRACALRNDDVFARLAQWLDDALVYIVRLVRNDCLCGPVLEQNIGTFQIMCLSRRQMKADWIAQCIHGGMNLRTQAASAASDR
jgi:hypothetical protein